MTSGTHFTFSLKEAPSGHFRCRKDRKRCLLRLKTIFLSESKFHDYQSILSCKQIHFIQHLSALL